jgi:hypothetical protein
LPNNLSVGGDLYLRGTQITSLPDNLTVGGNDIGIVNSIIKDWKEIEQTKGITDVGLKSIFSIPGLRSSDKDILYLKISARGYGFPSSYIKILIKNFNEYLDPNMVYQGKMIFIFP